MKKDNRGGKRIGAGRPRNDNKAFLIQCHPNCIKAVRIVAKQLSEKESLSNIKVAIENNVIVKKESLLEQKFNELIPIEFGGKMDEELLKNCVKICIDFSKGKL